MPKVFLTKVWGFNPEEYPVLGFTPRGGRTKFLREAGPGDWVVLAGTLEAPTPEPERGRLLGMVRLGRTSVVTEAVLNALGTVIPEEHRNADGSYKWPEGLPMLEAVRFQPPPRLVDIVGSNLTGPHWASFALDVAAKDEVGPAGVEKILALSTAQADIAALPEFVRQDAVDRAISAGRFRATSGPPPSFERSASMRAEGEGVAYLLRLQREDRGNWNDDFVFKVGCTHDVQQRLKKLNAEIRPAVTRCRWRIERSHPFESETQAFGFEQLLLDRLRRKIVDGERECVRAQSKEVLHAWDTELLGGRWSA